MTGRRSVLAVGLSALCALSLQAAAHSLLAAEPRVRLAIVTQKSSPLTELTMRELKRLYRGERLSSPDGTRLIPLNHASSSADRIGFERRALGMSADEIGRYWIDRKLRAQSGPPQSVASSELLRRAVATVAGTLTYLRVSDLKSDLKVLRIDGKQPSDAGYPLEY